MATFSNSAIFNPTRNASAAGTNTTAPAPANPCCCPACTGLQCLDRTRYFAGQLLSEADLNNDQSYWLAKSRLHNRYLHGWGVVCGLQVVCGPCDGWVTVKTGYGLDPCGNDIIVCSEQLFNVVKAIQACCTPPKAADCSPLRSAPPPNCQDAEQKWCITIQYEEQPTRTVTPLRQTSTQSCGCGCSAGSSKGGCGCGGKQAASNGTSSTACCCSTTPKQTSSTPGCEPTRILEGFKLGVCPAPTDSAGKVPAGNSSVANSPCVQGIRQLILQQPSLANVTDPNAAYTAVCNYMATIRNFLGSSSITHCSVEAALLGKQIPKPDQGSGYIAQLKAVAGDMVKLLTSLLLDCVCLLLLPQCPPDPCANCLVLACVTVKNGKIVDICHFGGGRRQVVTFPSLGYWLSLFGLDKLLTTVVNLLEELCCGEGDFSRLYQSSVAPEENISTAGVANPAMLSRFLSSTLAQNLGATVLNAAVTGARSVDLRPYVGLSLEEVNRAMKSSGVATNVVEASPAWTADVIAQAPQFAPSAFPAGQPLTVFTRNQLVVGFEPTSPTDALKSQVADLQAQVTALQNRIGVPAGAAKRPRKS